MTRSLTLFIAACGFAVGAVAAPSKADTGGLLTTYYAVQQALAADELTSAQSGAKTLAEQAGKADASEALRKAATALAESADIKAARTEFQPLSAHMQSLVESLGAEFEESVFVVRCPMAFGGKGGTWLQGDKTIANPYYGSAMLRCGSVVRQLSGSPSTAGAVHRHGMH